METKPSASIMGGFILSVANSVATVDWGAYMTNLGLKVIETAVLGIIGGLAGWGIKQFIDLLKNKNKQNVTEKK